MALLTGGLEAQEQKAAQFAWTFTDRLQQTKLGLTVIM
jgi:hypothetical protein